MARYELLDIAIPAAGTYTGTATAGVGNAAYLLIQAKFVRGSGGTSVTAYVQTSVDGGTTWIDVATFAFLTTSATKLHRILATNAFTAATVPTDGTLASDTILDGAIGDMLRVKYVVVGTYAASTLVVSVSAK